MHTENNVKKTRLLVVTFNLPFTFVCKCTNSSTQPLNPDLTISEVQLIGHEPKSTTVFTAIQQQQPISPHFRRLGSKDDFDALDSSNSSPVLYYSPHFNKFSGTGASKKKTLAEEELIIVPFLGSNIGLQNAINTLDKNEYNVMWIGGLSTLVDLSKHSNQAINQKLANVNSIPVLDIEPEMKEKFYDDLCKQVIWPLFHSLIPESVLVRSFSSSEWKMYSKVNAKFAQVIIDNYQEGDVIWINDYHLMMVPQMVRKAHPNAKIGFFLHIPFPCSDIFRILPCRKELIEGLLGANLIGFQTFGFQRHFCQALKSLSYNNSISTDSISSTVDYSNRDISVKVFSIGINLQVLKFKLSHPDVSEMAKLLLDKYQGKKIVVGRDKMDPIKGVKQKLKSFELFLRDYPQWHGKVVLIQVALSTSEKSEVQSQVLEQVSRINSRFGSISYQPVVFLRQDISFSHYLALLSVADACLITSLSDGMNLTSHEFIACQDQKPWDQNKEGKYSPLIISRYAGTCGNLRFAVQINPWNYKKVADAIHSSLIMDEEEKRERHRELYKYVSANSASFWASSIVECIKE